MNRKALQLALREMQEAARSRYSRTGMILVTVLLAISGPFGTFQSFSMGQRFGYWAVMVVAGYLTGQGATRFFLAVLGERLSQRWPRLIAAGLLASLPVTIVVLAVNGIAYRYVPAADSLTIWLYVIVVTLAVVVLFGSLKDLMAGAAPTADAVGRADRAAGEAAAQPAPAILERVPLPQRGRLLALSVEDHYVDIVTDRGKTLVLMRLADAMREAAPVAGLQIHRSHWVASGAVVRTHRGDGKLSLELSNGMRLPVSRGYQPAVKAAGLG